MKRFGRNQKRKMLDKIKLAESEVKRMERAVTYAESKTRKAAQIIDLINRINPDFPALNNAREIESNYYSRVAMRSRMQVRYITEDIPVDVPVEINHIDLHDLEADLIDDRNFNSTVTFVARAGENHKAYYKMSEQALKYASVDELALMLANNLKQSINSRANQTA